MNILATFAPVDAGLGIPRVEENVRQCPPGRVPITDSVTSASKLAQIRDVSDEGAPVLAPRGFTSASTVSSEVLESLAAIITAIGTWSIWRRRSGSNGKHGPDRHFEIGNSRSPTAADNVRG